MRSAEALRPWLRDMKRWVAPPGIPILPAGRHVDYIDPWLRGGGFYQPPTVRAQMLRRSEWAPVAPPRTVFSIPRYA